MEGSFRAGRLNGVDMLFGQVSPPGGSPLPDQNEAAQAANKGGTAFMTPFAENNPQRVFLFPPADRVMAAKQIAYVIYCNRKGAHYEQRIGKDL